MIGWEAVYAPMGIAREAACQHLRDIQSNVLRVAPEAEEEAGIIAGYRVELNLGMVGHPFSAILRVATYDTRSCSLMSEKIRQMPEVAVLPGDSSSSGTRRVDGGERGSASNGLRNLVQLVLFDHLDRGGAPDRDDPALRLALSPFEVDDEELPPEGMKALAGIEGHRWTPADFVGGQQAMETLGDNLHLFSQEWLGYLRHRHGVPFAKGELASFVFELLDPENSQPYRAAALLELLPLYLRFLVERGLLTSKEAGRSLNSP